MIVLSLFDLTGNMVAPWLEAGHTCILVDAQHPPGWREDGNLIKVGTMLWPFCDPVSQYDGPAPDLIFSFASCVDVAVSGARWFESKRKANPQFQRAAIQMLRFGEQLGQTFDCPWMVENPVGVSSKMWRKPDHWFHPWQYAGLCPDDQYVKKTGIWCGNGFVMPAPVPGTGVPDDRIHRAAPSPDRANFRSATPMGFARAVYQANCELVTCS